MRYDTIASYGQTIHVKYTCNELIQIFKTTEQLINTNTREITESSFIDKKGIKGTPELNCLSVLDKIQKNSFFPRICGCRTNQLLLIPAGMFLL